MSSSLKSIIWRTCVTVAILIVIVACFYAEENARGVRAWKNAEQELAARGESVKWDDYIPLPVPDDRNFYRAPMMTEWFVRSTNAGTGPSLYRLMENPENYTNYIDQISASNYLAWSAAFEPKFSQIRDALKRPDARIDGDYTKPFSQPVPNFVSYRVVSQVLAHRAKCHLLLGEPARALDDLTLLHQLDLTLVKTGKPVLLVTAMIHTAIAELHADAAGCGLESHSWREPELATLQKQFAEIHLLPVVINSLRNERASLCRLLDISSADQLIQISGSPNSASDLGWRIMPAGWIYQNKALIVTIEQRMIASVDSTNQTVSPYKAKAARAREVELLRHVTPMNFIAAAAIPNFSKALETMAYNQTVVDQAQIVCALERYRLAKGAYPAALSALTPDFLAKIPNDVVSGTPIKYLRKDEQNFTLYSIGWNEADDGGITVHNADGTEDHDNGDWVWQYPRE